MNFRNMGIAFAIALAVSGLCTYSLGRKLKAQSAQRDIGPKYVAPNKPLQSNEVLKAEDLTLVEWPSKNPIAGAFTKPQDLIGRTLLYPVEKGQPITEKLVSAPGAGTGLAGRIPDGMRAIALRSDEVMGVAGFLVPGSHLDVLVTYRSDRNPEPETMTVLQNAEVLAAGHQVEPDPNGKPASVTVVTLLLAPADAEKAVLASTQGTIHFVMRSGSDTHVVKDAPVMLSQLSGAAGTGSAPAPQAHEVRSSAPRVRRAPAPAVFTVETVLGDKQITNTFQMEAR